MASHRAGSFDYVSTLLLTRPTTTTRWCLWSPWCPWCQRQVGKRTTAGPDNLKQLYVYISLMELDSAVIANPACYDSYPFARELQFLVGSLVLTAVTAVFVFMHGSSMCGPTTHGPTRRAFSLLTRLCLTLMILMYPLIATLSLKMVNCSKDADSGKLVLVASAFYECYRDDHLAVGLLSWPVLLLHVFAFPVVTLAYLLRCVWKAGRGGGAAVVVTRTIAACVTND